MDAMEESKYTAKSETEVVLQKLLKEDSWEGNQLSKHSKISAMNFTRSVTAPFLTFFNLSFRIMFIIEFLHKWVMW